MKFLICLLIFTSFGIAYGTTNTNDIKITIEDLVDGTEIDYDANDIVMCTNWSWEVSESNANKVTKVTFGITPVAAGAYRRNAIYIKNPCNGSGQIELKMLEDSCGDPTIVENVTTNGQLVKLTDSFTTHGFSSECGRSNMINISTAEICAPNKSYVIVTCDSGNEFDLDNGVFPYADLFYVDSRGNGTDEENDDDDVHSGTISNGFSFMIIGDCSDPVPDEKVNFIDALGVRATLDSNDCQGNAQTCRNSIKSILSTKRNIGWSNFPHVRKRLINRDISISFDAPSLIGDNLYVKVNGRNKNPIYNTTEACNDDTDQGSDLQANTGDFAILAGHGGRLFQSSYSVYSLPEPGTISNNWNVTVKAINGPVYVYPSYNTTTETQPKINNKNYAILTTANTTVKFIYSDGNFSTTVTSGSIAHSITKDDAPENCPEGFAAIAGNYMLETTGFCVQSTGTNMSGTYINFLTTMNTTCSGIPAENTGGSANVVTRREWLTMMYDSLDYWGGAEDLVTNNCRGTYCNGSFANQFSHLGNGASFGSGCCGCNHNKRGGTITFLSGDTISAPGVNWNWGRHVSCQFPKYIYKYSQHKEVLAWDSFPTNSTGISSSGCGDSYNNVNLKDSPNNKRYMITLGDPSYYDNTTDQHLEERSTNCEFTNLDNQSGVRSTLSSLDRLDAFETVLQNSGNSYVPVWDSYYLRFDYVSPTAGGTNKGGHRKSRCVYYPN